MPLDPSVRWDDERISDNERLIARCRRRAARALWPLESSRWRRV